MNHYANYELIKQLKDAGFPQGDYYGNFFYSPRSKRKIKWVGFDDITDGDIKIPTLKELIEACGDGFGGLFGSKAKGWCCYEFPQDLTAIGKTDWSTLLKGYEPIHGNTPEEAVARLWLALNQK